MIAAVLVLLLAATATAVALGLRLPSPAATAVTAYVVALCEISGLTALLSPARAVDRGWLGAVEAVLLAVAVSFWSARGRPLPGVATAGRIGIALRTDWVATAFVAVVATGVLYELVLGLTVPANNWDSLTYHLPRVAAWLQHGGITWVPNAPTDRINEFQPVAEQQILYLFVATGNGRLFALPQLVAEVAIVLATYRTARLLGFGARASACSAALFGTFAVVAEEATTAQNDLVAAALVAAAVSLLLEKTDAAAAIGGVAAGLALGTKLTTAFALPVPLLLAAWSGRRPRALAAAGFAGSFLALTAWSFVLNVVHTGHVLGHGGGRVEHTASPSFPGSAVTLAKVVYGLLDLSGYLTHTIDVLLVAGAATAVVLVAAGRRLRMSVTSRLLVLLVVLAPPLVREAAAVARHVVDAISPGMLAAPNRRANEDLSAFGPLGGLALGGACIWGVHRRADRRRVALAAALPAFVVLLALASKYNPWLSRFLIVPAALTAPLTARLFSDKVVAAAIAAVSVLSLALVLRGNELKPLHSRFGRPWSLSPYQAVELNWQPAAGHAAQRLDEIVPRTGCVGALLGSDDPAYLLYGPALRRDVVYLPRTRPVDAALSSALADVVVTRTGDARTFESSGWTRHWLPSAKERYWLLLTRPRPAGSAACGG